MSSSNREHLDCRQAFIRAVIQPLMSRDICDRAQSRATNLPDPLGNVVDHLENLIGLLIQEQVIFAKVAPADVPVKALGFQI